MSERQPVFLSYAREDRAFVERLVKGLEASGQECWLDTKRIRPSADWMREVREAIVGARAFVFVISPASARSEVCRQEVEHAAAVGKRILPVLKRQTRPESLPEPVAERNWIAIGPGRDLEKAVDTLVAAIETDPEWAAAHTRLAVRAAEWERIGRGTSFLLRGEDLAGAEEWLADADERKDPQPTHLQNEYILASRRQRSRVQRIRTGVLAVGLAIAAVLTIYALVQRGQAEDRARLAHSRELAASALAQKPTNPGLALLLAVEAAEEDHTAEAERAIRETLVDAHGRSVLSGHADEVRSIAVSPDTESVATASADGTARVWDPDTGREIRRLDPGAGALTDVAFGSGGSRLYATTEEGRITAWDPSTGAASVINDSGPPLNGIAVSRDGRVLAAGSDRGVGIWTAGGRHLRDLRGVEGRTLDLGFSPDGERLVTAGADGAARVWAVPTGKLTQTLLVDREPGAQPGDDVNSALFSPDGRSVITASDDGFARIWSPDDRRVRLAIPASEDYLTSASFGPNGRRVVTGSFDGRARVWDTGSGRAELIATFSSPAGNVLRVAFLGRGGVATAHSDGLARTWDIGASDVVTRLRHGRDVQAAAFSPDGTRVVTSVADSTARLWDVATERQVAPPMKHPDVVWGAEFSDDGSEIVTADGRGDVRIWSASGEPLERHRPTHKLLYSAEFGPDPARVVFAGVAGAAILARGEAGTADALPLRPTPEGVGDAAFDGAGKIVATAGIDKNVRVWDAASGSELMVLKGHSDLLNSVAVSADGRRIASASEDRTARVWDAESGETIAVLRGHAGGVLGVAFSPDGKQVATGGVDHTVRVWDTESGQLLDVLEGPTDWVNGVAYSPDGSEILAASADNHAYVFRCQVCEPFPTLLSIAQSRVGAALTGEERDQYLREAGIEP